MVAELLSLGRVGFRVQAPVSRSAPTRADIACFVGFVLRRPGELPDSVLGWLDEYGWLAGPYARAADAEELRDVPVPIESWASFDQLFAWEQRVGGASTYLGAAVRSFFAQGGRRCYVVRVGNPIPLGTPRVERLRLVDPLLGLRRGIASTPGDRAGWRGIRHLHGLPDVSFVCVPDLPDLLGADPQPAPTPPPPAPPEPVFEECALRELEEQPAEPVPQVGVARMGAAEYADWAGVINGIARLLKTTLREVQLLAAVPLPSRDEPQDRAIPRFLVREFLNISLEGGREPTGLGSSFVQLAYPWAVTPGAARLPEGIEPPDGILAGVIARVTLLSGAYRTAAGSRLEDVTDLVPRLTRADFAMDDERERGLTVLPDRISTLGRTPRGLQLLSDNTPALNEAYRPAAVHRLVSILIRSARRLGETLVWEPSGEPLWDEIRRLIEGLLETLWEMGVLTGATSAEAFGVRCDRSTMTDDDLENGRLRVEVSFTASAPIERVTVTLAIDESGQISLLEPVTAAA